MASNFGVSSISLPREEQVTEASGSHEDELIKRSESDGQTGKF